MLQAGPSYCGIHSQLPKVLLQVPRPEQCIWAMHSKIVLEYIKLQKKKKKNNESDIKSSEKEYTSITATSIIVMIGNTLTTSRTYISGVAVTSIC